MKTARDTKHAPRPSAQSALRAPTRSPSKSASPRPAAGTTHHAGATHKSSDACKPRPAVRPSSVPTTAHTPSRSPVAAKPSASPAPKPLLLAKSAAAPKPAIATKTASPKPAAPAAGGVVVAPVPEDKSRNGKKPKPPAKTMKVPAPVTDILVKQELPDVRRVAGSSALSDDARGLANPAHAQRPREVEPRNEPPVDARLIASSLAGEVRPRIEDNYDYSVLEEFVSSGHCPSPTRMVNTGCGGGEAAVYFARRGFNVVGIDSDRTAVGLARERAWLAGTEIDFMVGDLFETPNLLPAESFGLALDRGAFYHLTEERDRQRYLQNIRRLLFRGGVFLLSAGFFPLPESARPKGGAKPPKGPRKPVPKILLVREGGVVVNEVRHAGFEVAKRVLRTTADSGDMGELILTLVR